MKSYLLGLSITDCGWSTARVLPLGMKFSLGVLVIALFGPAQTLKHETNQPPSNKKWVKQSDGIYKGVEVEPAAEEEEEAVKQSDGIYKGVEVEPAAEEE